MGCMQSTNAAGAESDSGGLEKRTNQEIERQLKRDKEAMRNTVKMLLLGAGESGKSTLVKQMRLIYSFPYTEQERLSYREVVFSNALQSICAVLKGYELLGMPIPAHLVADAELLGSFDPDHLLRRSSDSMDEAYATAIEHLWKCSETKSVLASAHRFQLNDSAIYFFNNIARIGRPHYIPTDADILRTRVRSTGITEEVFQVKAYTVKVFDVGGQRSERKKWIHCFEGVQVLVFVVAISEYDQQLWEDESVNRMTESLMLFESIASSRWFETSSFVLLLNKTDLFTEKILSGASPLSARYPDFPSSLDGNVDEAKKFLRSMFISLDQGKRQLYSHFTCATDTEQVKVVIAAVLDTVLSNLLTEVGML